MPELIATRVAAAARSARRTRSRRPRPPGPGRACPTAHDAIDGGALLVADDRLGRGDQVVHCVYLFQAPVAISTVALVGHRAGPAAVARRRAPGARRRVPTQPTRRAGLPTTSAKSGTSLMTTEPEPTSAQRPISTGATQVRAGADRRALADGDADRLPVVRRLGRAVGVDRAREVVVGQHDGRADEDAGARAARARRRARSSGSCSCRPLDAGADVGAAADDAVLAEPGVFADLRVVPDLRTLAEMSRCRRRRRWDGRTAPTHVSRMCREPGSARSGVRSAERQLSSCAALRQQITKVSQPNSARIELSASEHDDQRDQRQGRPGVHDAAPAPREQPGAHEGQPQHPDEDRQADEPELEPDVEVAVERRLRGTVGGGGQGRERDDVGVPAPDPAPALQEVEAHQVEDLVPELEAVGEGAGRVEGLDDPGALQPGEDRRDDGEPEHDELPELPPVGAHPAEPVEHGRGDADHEGGSEHDGRLGEHDAERGEDQRGHRGQAGDRTGAVLGGEADRADDREQAELVARGDDPGDRTARAPAGPAPRAAGSGASIRSPEKISMTRESSEHDPQDVAEQRARSGWSRASGRRRCRSA